MVPLHALYVWKYSTSVRVLPLHTLYVWKYSASVGALLPNISFVRVLCICSDSVSVRVRVDSALASAWRDVRSLSPIQGIAQVEVSRDGRHVVREKRTGHTRAVLSAPSTLRVYDLFVDLCVLLVCFFSCLFVASQHTLTNQLLLQHYTTPAVYLSSSPHSPASHSHALHIDRPIRPHKSFPCTFSGDPRYVLC